MRTGTRLGLTLLAATALVAACAGPAPVTTDVAMSPSVSASTSSTTSSPSPTNAPPTEPPAPSATPIACDGPLRVALVTHPGGVTDTAYDQSAWEGMEAAAAAAPGCFETAPVEVADPAQYPATLSQLAAEGLDVVIGSGVELSDPLGDAAKAHPDTIFVGVDTIPTSGHDETWNTNGLSLFFAEDQAGYLAGVLAASMSASNHVGAVGSFVTLPPVERFVEGYVRGAKDTRPEIEVSVAYTNSLADPLQGRNAGTNMTSQGADVIFAAAGVPGARDSTASGALLAACDADGWAIGADTDLFLTLEEAQGCLLSSAVKNVSGAVRDALLRIARDEFQPGIHVDDAATGGIGLAPYHDHDAAVGEDVRALIESTLAGLADGSIDAEVEIDGHED